MEIKLYMTPTCLWSKKTKDWLKSKKKPFIEFDIVESDKSRDEMIEKSGQMATPVIDIDGRIIVGFNEQKLEESIKNAEKKKNK